MTMHMVNVEGRCPWTDSFYYSTQGIDVLIQMQERKFESRFGRLNAYLMMIDSYLLPRRATPGQLAHETGTG